MKKKSSRQSIESSQFPVRIIALFILIFAVFGSVFIFSAHAAPKNPAAVSLYIEPASKRVAVGDTLSLGIKVNTNGQPVNAVQANLSYPANNFDFVSIDSTGSVFAMEAQSTGGNGTVAIARGSTTPVTNSSALVATVNLRAKASSRKLNVNFIAGTAVINATTNLDILQKKTGGQYSIQ